MPKKNTKEAIVELAKKLHKWQWEACIQELPNKHQKKIPEYNSLDGDRTRILLALAERVFIEITTTEEQARESEREKTTIENISIFECGCVHCHKRAEFVLNNLTNKTLKENNN